MQSAQMESTSSVLSMVEIWGEGSKAKPILHDVLEAKGKRFWVRWHHKARKRNQIWGINGDDAVTSAPSPSRLPGAWVRKLLGKQCQLQIGTWQEHLPALNNNHSACYLPLWRPNPVLLQGPVLWTSSTQRGSSGWAEALCALGNPVEQVFRVRRFQERISWSQCSHLFISRKALKSFHGDRCSSWLAANLW